MYWADRIAKEIISSGKYTPFWVDDMKTPSGYAHVGSLRGPLIHDIIFRALKDAGHAATFTFVFNDFDPADEFPLEFKEKLASHAGKALRMIPSPSPDFANLADLLANDLKKVMIELGMTATYLSSWEMYKQGKFDTVIRESLDNAELIQDIYKKVSGSKKKEQGWLPFQVICEKCQKVGTTKVYAWDGKEVSYKCEPSLVTWAKGCGHEGKVSPFGGTGKLPWKVDWPAHWKVIGVTIECAGKDHASAGGSYDIAMEICEKVFKYPKPFKLPYEFFLIGGKKMSSSKGLGIKAQDITKILPASVARFLFVRSNYKEQINFDPVSSMAIPDIFDEYDEAAAVFWSGTNKDLARTFELSQIKDRPFAKMFLPRFRDVANYLTLPNVDLVQKFGQMKGSSLTHSEKEVLEERIKYAKVWLENYAPEEFKVEFKEILSDKDIKILSEEQKKYLGAIIELVEKESDPESLQTKLYEKAKELGVDTKSAFAGIYLTLIGRDHGPKAAWFLLSFPKKKVVARLKEVVSMI